MSLVGVAALLALPAHFGVPPQVVGSEELLVRASRANLDDISTFCFALDNFLNKVAKDSPRVAPAILWGECNPDGIDKLERFLR